MAPEDAAEDAAELDEPANVPSSINPELNVWFEARRSPEDCAVRLPSVLAIQTHGDEVGRCSDGCSVSGSLRSYVLADDRRKEG